MRPLTFALAAILALATAGRATWLPYPASAEHTARDYSVAFQAGSGKLILEGALGEANRKAIARIMTAIAEPPPAALRLIFVLRGPPDGNSSRLALAKLRTLEALRPRAAEAADPRVWSSFAYDDELNPRPELPAEPPGARSLHLRLVGRAPSRDGGCPFRIRLHDPALPPLIGPIGPPATLFVSRNASISVVMPDLGQTVARVLWRLEEPERFQRVDLSAAEKGVAAPSLPATLYLLALAVRHYALAAIDRWPADTAVYDPAIAAWLDGRSGGAFTPAKGLGDDPGPLGSNGPDIRVAPPARVEVHCALKLSSRR